MTNKEKKTKESIAGCGSLLVYYFALPILVSYGWNNFTNLPKINYWIVVAGVFIVLKIKGLILELLKK